MYSRNSGRNRTILFVAIIVAALSVALVYSGDREGVVSQSQHLLLAATAPLQKAVNVVISPFKRVSQYTLVIGNLTNENRRLKHDNIVLRQEVDHLKRYEAENRRLQRLAGFRRESQPKTVGARVISRSPTSWQSIVTIDVGSSAGVGENMAVITDKGLVGRTVRVAGSAALVQLLDDRRSGVGVEIARSGATGIIEGSMEGRLKLRFLAADADVKVGDKLLTSGVGGVYPRGIAVGAVAGIAKTAYSLEKNIDVRPAVDYARLSEVLVINDSEAARSKL
ncbi:MAG: rod shape-determining protein MreC [Actinomycetota bacterium]|nr:rod shape-determining protein MreC [Actinomycetota bacterium]